MPYTVSARAGHESCQDPTACGLYTPRGARKYLTRDERQRLLALCASRPGRDALLALTLLWTGARVSEGLALTPLSFQLDASLVALCTLKRRRPVVREMPVPPALLAALEAHFGLRAAQAAGDAHRLWACSRVTAWRHVKALMAEAGIHGVHACPKGLRHGFGVATVQSGTPITLTQRWMGHARLTNTAIYTEVSGPEERGFAEAFFAWSQESRA